MSVRVEKAREINYHTDTGDEMSATTEATEQQAEPEIPPDPTEVKVVVSFTRHQYGTNQATVHMTKHTSVENAPRDRKVYRLTVPVPEDAFEGPKVAGEMDAEIEKVAGPCSEE